MLYDSLLCFLWSWSTFMNLIAGPWNKQEHGTSLLDFWWIETADGSMSCSTARGMLGVACLATVLYGTKCICSLLEVAQNSRSKLWAKDDPEAMAQRGQSATGVQLVDDRSDYVDKVYKEALSPVLAFFPE
ncbi:hypothetical protein B0I35DRAFT_74336 [Stachybotrys elegans]|uniref:Uncharacterized protein n=1 Tax=Stachybotrys elegans TaxID=80388 RepID=A0A8K0WMV7_9HYPO|nr:hypothetical protein B0I35DRAFT_74336 [Stachybotrys elegans]